MINSIMRACEKAIELTGIPIKIPRPGKKDFRISSITNGLIGIVFLLIGVLTRYKWALAMGVLGIIGSVITAMEAKK